MHVEKAIVTNLSALRRKYGRRYPEVRAALAALVAADARRGLSSKVIPIDSASGMARLGARAVAGARDRRGAKAAVDAIDAVLEPAYIVLVGGPDVVPMQLLENPVGIEVYGPAGDDDGLLPSDLPYACDAPFGRRIADFAGPGRVVGRLPDVPGAKDPDVLLRVLRHAARARPAPRARYERWFAVSAQPWLQASRDLLAGVYGRIRAGELHLSPGKSKRAWARGQLAGAMHYVNCHGGPFDPTFEGELETVPFPRETALSSAQLAGKVPRGAILVAECCYGAHLYDPHDRRVDPAARGRLGIALEYLRQGAHAVLASTTTAYGGETACDNADLLCRDFMRRVLAGASLGRAMLEARQALLSSEARMHPLALKTLAQFVLLGDPSIHPVRHEVRPARRNLRDPFTPREAAQLTQRLRRRNLRNTGLVLAATFPRLTEGRPMSRLSAHRLAGRIARALGYDDRKSIDQACRIFDLSAEALGPRAHIRRTDIRGARQVAVGMRRTIGDGYRAVIWEISGRRWGAPRVLVSR